MSPCKRRRTSTAAPPPEATLVARTLPSDLMLEIIARTDAATLVRCAACCKPLRRDILTPDFIRRVCHAGPDGGAAVVPARLFGYLPTRRKFTKQAESQGAPPPAAFSLAHPATPAAADFAEKHLVPVFSRGGGDGIHALTRSSAYELFTSRNGLAVFQRSYSVGVPANQRICVYDLMTGDRTFIFGSPEPLGVFKTYVPLAASDGISGSIFLLKADFTGLRLSCSIKVQTVSWSTDEGSGVWGPAITSAASHRSHGCQLNPCCGVVVLGGSIHWVMRGWTGRGRLHVLTYKVGARTTGIIELPLERLPKGYGEFAESNLRLVATGGRLTMLTKEKLEVSVWVMSADTGNWALNAVIDTESPLRSLAPEMPQPPLSPPYPWILFQSSGERSGVLTFSVKTQHRFHGIIVLDIETKEMHRVDGEMDLYAIPFEVDLESRLLAMKTF
ncbi:hypothetical protein BS78_05G063600 [Paspalum vaginatum]|nr:hypothetical protein BS78_05G063600 [Paspalum vaginatum]